MSRTKYTLEYKCLNAEIQVWNKLHSTSPVYGGKEVVSLKFEFDDAQTVRDILDHLSKDTREMISYQMDIPSHHNPHWTGKMDIFRDGFDQYLTEVKQSSPFKGGDPALYINGQPAQVDPNNPNAIQIQLNHGIDFVMAEITLDNIGPKCDCGAAACGHKDPGPAHSDWCELMQGGLPE